MAPSKQVSIVDAFYQGGICITKIMASLNTTSTSAMLTVLDEVTGGYAYGDIGGFQKLFDIHDTELAEVK